MVYRIMVIDDQPASRIGLRCHFEASQSFEIERQMCVGSADGKLLADTKPDIVILDPASHDDWMEVVRKHKSADPGLLIVIYSRFADCDDAQRALDAGANAIVSKSADLLELDIALNRIIRGDTYLDPETASAIIAKLKHDEIRSKLRTQVQFSVREEQVIRGLIKGRTNREIAQSLNLSEKTIKYYVGSLKDKLSVQNRLQIAMTAREQLYA